MTQIKLRRDTLANFTSSNPVLGLGEPAYETDTKRLKIGDGNTPYTQLDYFSSGGGSSDISASLPLKLEDGVISLEVDGQTIQIVDGKLHANIDELGNEVNDLSGRVTAAEADILTTQNDITDLSGELDEKEDKITAVAPITLQKYVKTNTVGFTQNSDGSKIYYSGSLRGVTDVMNFDSQSDGNRIYGFRTGFATLGSDGGINFDGYIRIPYKIGQAVKIPYKQNVADCFYCKTLKSGAVVPICFATYRPTSISTSDSFNLNAFGSGLQNISTWNKQDVSTSSETAVGTTSWSGHMYGQIKEVDGGLKLFYGLYLNSKFYSITVSTSSAISRIKEIDCVILVPRISRSTFAAEFGASLDTTFNTSDIGVYDIEGDLSTMLTPETEPAAVSKNLFDLSSVTSMNYLELSVGDGLTVSDNKLVNTNPTPYTLPTASTDTLGGVKIGDNLSISDEGVLSATDTTYTAGENITITDGVISATSSSSAPDNMVTTDTEQTITGGKTFSASTIFQYTDDSGTVQSRIRGGEFSLGTSAYTNNIEANILHINAGTTYNNGVLRVGTSSTSSSNTQISTSTITSTKETTLANMILKTTRPVSSSSTKNYAVLYSEVDSSYNHKLTVNNLTSDLVLAGKTVKDSSDNAFLTQGNVTAGDNVSIENTDAGIKISSTGGSSSSLESYVNETSGYTIFPEDNTGYRLCIQWGRVTLYNTNATVTFLKPYVDANYNVTQAELGRSGQDAYVNGYCFSSLTASSMVLVARNDGVNTCFWQTIGYISSEN